MADETKTEKTLQSVGKELRDNPPTVLVSTKRKFGAARAESQRRAILLSKARRMGARIPKPKSMKE
jgi:hypothetical protein